MTLEDKPAAYGLREIERKLNVFFKISTLGLKDENKVVTLEVKPGGDKIIVSTEEPKGTESGSGK